MFSERRKQQRNALCSKDEAELIILNLNVFSKALEKFEKWKPALSSLININLKLVVKKVFKYIFFWDWLTFLLQNNVTQPVKTSDLYRSPSPGHHPHYYFSHVVINHNHVSDHGETANQCEVCIICVSANYEGDRPFADSFTKKKPSDRSFQLQPRKRKRAPPKQQFNQSNTQSPNRPEKKKKSTWKFRGW